jgi:hypothetical protein
MFTLSPQESSGKVELRIPSLRLSRRNEFPVKGKCPTRPAESRLHCRFSDTIASVGPLL